MLAVSSIVSRVVPGMAETMARSWPRSWFNKLDLPAFGRLISVSLNPRMVRGLDYYCRTAFEIVADNLGAQNAIGVDCFLKCNAASDTEST